MTSSRRGSWTPDSVVDPSAASMGTGAWPQEAGASHHSALTSGGGRQRTGRAEEGAREAEAGTRAEGGRGRD